MLNRSIVFEYVDRSNRSNTLRRYTMTATERVLLSDECLPAWRGNPWLLQYGIQIFSRCSWMSLSSALESSGMMVAFTRVLSHKFEHCDEFGTVEA